MWFIGVEVEEETSAPPPKKNPGSTLWRSDTEMSSNGEIISSPFGFEAVREVLSFYDAQECR